MGPGTCVGRREVIIPEIADYEIRRELLRARKSRGIAKLDALAHWLESSSDYNVRDASRSGVLGRWRDSTAIRRLPTRRLMPI